MRTQISVKFNLSLIRVYKLIGEMPKNGSIKTAKTKCQVDTTVACQWGRGFLRARTGRTAEFSKNQASEERQLLFT